MVVAPAGDAGEAWDAVAVERLDEAVPFLEGPKCAACVGIGTARCHAARHHMALQRLDVASQPREPITQKNAVVERLPPAAARAGLPASAPHPPRHATDWPGMLRQ